MFSSGEHHYAPDPQSRLSVRLTTAATLCPTHDPGRQRFGPTRSPALSLRKRPIEAAIVFPGANDIGTVPLDQLFNVPDVWFRLTVTQHK